jgi:hypothetical protein
MKAMENGDTTSAAARGAIAWLDAMSPALDVVTKALERDRFHDPSAWVEQGKYAWTMFEISKGLRWRAMRSSVAGDFDAAGADFRANLKLARLEHELGVDNYSIVAFGDESYCVATALHAARLRGWITVAEVRALVAADDPATVEQRILDLRTSERLRGLEALDEILRPGTRFNTNSRKLVPLVARLDPNEVRRRQNFWYDREAAELASAGPWNERLARFQRFWKSESVKRPFDLGGARIIVLLCKGPDAVTRELFDSFSIKPAMVSGYVLGPLLETDRALIELAALAFATESGRDPISSDELTPLLFAEPWRDRATRSSVTFHRDAEGKLVADGALVKLIPALRELYK